MMKFTALLIALVLAPGIQSSAVSRAEISNYPAVIDVYPEKRPLPLPFEPVAPDTKPLPLPVEEIVPVIPETKPVPVEANPCEACFSYMTILIDQLTETVEPQLPEYLPEPPVEAPVEVGIGNMPIFPDAPQIGIGNMPIFPDAPQIGIGNMPVFPVVPEVGVRPLPVVAPALTNF